MQKFQRSVSLRLLLWALFSMVSGLFMLRRGKFWQGMGTQFIAWGAIDGLIAVGGQVASDNRLKKTSPDDMPAQLKKDKRNLRIALWINAGLDVLYMLGGIRWMKSQRGQGMGVLLQGTFLFVFDLYHAIKLQEIDPSDSD